MQQQFHCLSKHPSNLSLCPSTRPLPLLSVLLFSPLFAFLLKTSMFILTTLFLSTQKCKKRALKDAIVMSSAPNRTRGLHVVVNAPHTLLTTVSRQTMIVQRAAITNHDQRREQYIVTNAQHLFLSLSSSITQTIPVPGASSSTPFHAFLLKVLPDEAQHARGASSAQGTVIAKCPHG